MQKKRYLSLLTALALILANGAGAVNAAEESADISESQYESSSDADDEYVMRNEQDVLSTMTEVCENEGYIFFYSENEDLLALKDKKSKNIMWSSPVNAMGDPYAKGMIKNELASSLVLTYGDSVSRTTGTFRSAKNGKISYEIKGNTLRAVYRFNAGGFIIPVEYTLEEDGLSASVNTSEIKENKTSEGKLLLGIKLLPNFFDSSETDEGYFVIPDGCGARISFNNGKTNAETYTGSIYGRDITAVSLYKPPVSEQITMPVYASVRKDGESMLAVIESGDSNACLEAAVSRQSKTSYNICSSKFILRSEDIYYMNKEPLTVFEKEKSNTPKLKIKFFPLGGKDVDFSDAAAKYREYLLTVKNLTVKECDYSLFVSFYGGTEKKESVLGIPFTVKKAVTTFDEAKNLVKKLADNGVSNIAADYSDWTDAQIENKIETGASPSSKLGSKKSFRSMKNYFRKKNVSFYPVSENIEFCSGNGYMEYSDTAVRASGQLSRQKKYNLAYNTEDEMSDPVSLLSPNELPDIFKKLSKAYKKSEIPGFSPGGLSYSLFADYGKKSASRDDMMRYVSEGVKKCREDTGSVLLENPNAYLFEFADIIKGIPVSSGRYDIFDEDIPFCQMVLHGIVPYSVPAVNKSSDPDKSFLMAAATGSCLCFDLIDEEISKLKDTKYDKFYYADASFWIDTASEEYKALAEILEPVKNETIESYKRSGNIIETKYSDKTVIKVDLDKKEITSGTNRLCLEDIRKTGGES